MIYLYDRTVNPDPASKFPDAGTKSICEGTCPAEPRMPFVVWRVWKAPEDDWYDARAMNRVP